MNKEREIDAKELDALNLFIHEQVMGWQYDPSRKCWHLGGYWTAEPSHYSTDPAAAMMVLRACAEKLDDPKKYNPGILITKFDSDWIVAGAGFTAKAPALELAITLFAKALFQGKE